jgi:hypothetical protein
MYVFKERLIPAFSQLVSSSQLLSQKNKEYKKQLIQKGDLVSMLVVWQVGLKHQR